MARQTRQKYRVNPNVFVEPAIPAVIDKLLQYVLIPHMYDNKGYSLDLNQAIRTLESKHLNVNPVRVSITEASPKFKDCRNNEIIGSRPKQGSPVPMGSSVTVKYITQDVIDESVRLFRESQNAEARRIQDKKEKRSIKRIPVKTVPQNSDDKPKHIFLKAKTHTKHASQPSIDISEEDRNE